MNLTEQWRGALAFEWTKLAGVRSTWLCLIIAALSTVGLGMLLGASAKASGDNGYAVGDPSPYLAFQSVLFVQFLIVVIATLFITSEYASGAIKTTLQSVPVRGRMLASKLIVIGLGGFVSGVLLNLLGTAATAPFAQEYGTFTAAQLVRTSLMTGVYLALLAVLVVGFGTALRNAAGTITWVIALLLIIPQILPIFRLEWLVKAADYLPTNAALVLGLNLTEPYGGGMAALILCGWAALGVVVGALVLRGRDA